MSNTEFSYCSATKHVVLLLSAINNTSAQICKSNTAGLGTRHLVGKNLNRVLHNLCACSGTYSLDLSCVLAFLYSTFSAACNHALCSFLGRHFLTRRERCLMPKQTKLNKMYSFSSLNKQTDLNGRHNFTLFCFCLHVVDPATSQASNSVPGILFPSEISLFIHLWAK